MSNTRMERKPAFKCLINEHACRLLTVCDGRVLISYKFQMVSSPLSCNCMWKDKKKKKKKKTFQKVNNNFIFLEPRKYITDP